MATYEVCPPEVRALLGELVDTHFEEIAKAELTIDLLFAYADKDKYGMRKGPALSKRGHECAAIVSKTPVKDRIRGLRDVLILIDGDHWPDWTLEQRRALLHHELTHIDIERIDGEVKHDSAGRPVVAMRPHDFEVGGFHEVIDIYGIAAMEARMLVAAAKPYAEQMEFAFGDGTKTRVKKKKAS